MKKNLIFIISIIIFFILFLFIRRNVINNGYEFLSWVYHCMFLTAIATIVIETIFFISRFFKKWDMINCSLISIILELPICLFIYSIIAFKINLKSDSIITLESNDKIVESRDFFTKDPTFEYYEYINCFLRDNRTR